jgi:ribonucleotide reductase beta subunit family protein with ferritin-like domain
MFKYYEDQMNRFWLAKEVADFKALPAAERHAIIKILANFASADGLVLENTSRDFPTMGAKCFAAAQGNIEVVHAEVYTNFLRAYVTDPNELEACFRAIVDQPSIRAKAQWAMKYLGPDVDPDVKNTGFAIVETMLFPASFAVIFWLRTNHSTKLHALVHANRLIALDENLHSDAWCHYVRESPTRPSPELITQMVREAAELEVAFVKDVIPVDLWGLSQKSMIQYVHYVADFTLAKFGVEPAYGVKCPFDFMLGISLNSREAVHEVAGANYDKVEKSVDDFDEATI